MLPDRSVLIGQQLVENAKIKKSKCDILSNFQTMCVCLNDFFLNLRLQFDPRLRVGKGSFSALLMTFVLVTFTGAERNVKHAITNCPSGYN